MRLEGKRMEITRLDKLIADSGRASRREAKALVKAGRVIVNGEVPASADDKYDAQSVEISIDGVPISCSRVHYILMNKPGGVLCATEDSTQRTVIDLLPKHMQRLGLFPVGRLDKDTTGFLLLTNDGDYAHRVISPKHHVPKLYRAAVDGVLDAEDIRAFAEGIVLSDGTQCLPAKLEIVRPSVGNVTVYEGKYHQVKRMLAARGKPVTALHRFQTGALVLDRDLKAGQFRELTKAEAELVFESLP